MILIQYLGMMMKLMINQWLLIVKARVNKISLKTIYFMKIIITKILRNLYLLTKASKTNKNYQKLLKLRRFRMMGFCVQYFWRRRREKYFINMSKISRMKFKSKEILKSWIKRLIKNVKIIYRNLLRIP